MPKMKSHKGARKRFKVTASGEIKRGRAFKSHILTKKTSKRKRRLRRGALIATRGDVKRMKRLLQSF
jgi:large subunit ribosomal protein L35